VVLGKYQLFNSGLALTFQAAQLGLQAQSVMAVRLMKLRGGTRGATEARLMISLTSSLQRQKPVRCGNDGIDRQQSRCG
jgi:hypothetical protein